MPTLMETQVSDAVSESLFFLPTECATLDVQALDSTQIIVVECEPDDSHTSVYEFPMPEGGVSPDDEDSYKHLCTEGTCIALLENEQTLEIERQLLGGHLLRVLIEHSRQITPN